MPTNDGRLFSLDADTGKPDPEFGIDGVVDLTQGLGRKVDRKFYSVISAPTVVKNTLIVGSSIMDGPTHKEMPPGHIRGFDAETGSQRWRFNTIPQVNELAPARGRTKLGHTAVIPTCGRSRVPILSSVTFTCQ